MDQGKQYELDFSIAPNLAPAVAARRLGLSESTLAKMRVYGGGPEYVKLGRSVRYPEDRLAVWLEERVRTSTSDTGLAS
jgi:predicted DNA-binding transcriptional regulator AlpA